MQTRWTEELIGKQIKEFYNSTGKFPSNNALNAIGMSGLSNKIVKTGGFHYWADKLGIRRDHSDSDFGRDGEKVVLDCIAKIGMAAKLQEGQKSPFDILVENCVRVDVKTAKYAEYGACRGWFYRIGKYMQSDIVALLQFDTGHIYWIPWFLVPCSNITISRSGGKYANFKDNIGILVDYAEFACSNMKKTSDMII